MALAGIVYASMTDDEFLRALIMGAGIAIVGVFREPIMGWLRKIGYRGWR